MKMQATGQTVAAPRPALSPTDLSMLKGIVVGFWIVTASFCLQIGFTAYAQLRLPQVAASRHTSRLHFVISLTNPGLPM